MSEPIEEGPSPPPAEVNPAAVRAAGIGLLALVAAAGVAFALLRPAPEPPPPDVAADPLLRSGREVYLARCVSCHGPKGRGDGPLVKNLAGPKVGDLTSERWKHGDAPAQVTSVVAEGVPDSTMPGWGRTLSADEMKGVVAYVYHLSGRTVPDQLRGRGP